MALSTVVQFHGTEHSGTCTKNSCGHQTIQCCFADELASGQMIDGLLCEFRSKCGQVGRSNVMSHGNCATALQHLPVQFNPFAAFTCPLPVHLTTLYPLPVQFNPFAAFTCPLPVQFDHYLCKLTLLQPLPVQFDHFPPFNCAL